MTGVEHLAGRGSAGTLALVRSHDPFTVVRYRPPTARTSMSYDQYP